ncbi:MAG: ComEA family DNA-binding protein [Nitrospirales bacterium]
MTRDLVRSAISKAALLAVTAGLVLWIGWPGAWEDENRDELIGEGFTRATDGEAGDGTSWPFSIQLDLNRATADELRALPGIGAVLAERVIRYRDSHGPFRTVEELQHVKGIGRKTLEKLRVLVTVEHDESAGPLGRTTGPPE